MKIGIIIHSHSGNTQYVAERLQEKLETAGHNVIIEKIIPADNNPDTIKYSDIVLKNMPDISPYEMLIFAGPVRGASASPVLAAYLTKLSTLKNKKVACFVTEAFPFPWMGGNRAVRQLIGFCEKKGVDVRLTGIINWMNSKREKMIEDLIERFSKALQEEI
ncbi:MAG: flavodoxin family protein [Bacillota bacterium]